MEHILVAERVLGRPLVWHGQHDPRSEIVHHLNGDKSDNRPENLEVTTNAEHGRAHYEERAFGRRVTSDPSPLTQRALRALRCGSVAVAPLALSGCAVSPEWSRLPGYCLPLALIVFPFLGWKLWWVRWNRKRSGGRRDFSAIGARV